MVTHATLKAEACVDCLKCSWAKSACGKSPPATTPRHSFGEIGATLSTQKPPSLHPTPSLPHTHTISMNNDKRVHLLFFLYFDFLLWSERNERKRHILAPVCWVCKTISADGNGVCLAFIWTLTCIHTLCVQ